MAGVTAKNAYGNERVLDTGNAVGWESVVGVRGSPLRMSDWEAVVASGHWGGCAAEPILDILPPPPPLFFSLYHSSFALSLL
ncbi:hypothetical protein FS842_007154 [Serendipita sp. 407]|nr:hypothetical protein FS842_007154 [Serendipita sp. 407]